MLFPLASICSQNTQVGRLFMAALFVSNFTRLSIMGVLVALSLYSAALDFKYSGRQSKSTKSKEGNSIKMPVTSDSTLDDRDTSATDKEKDEKATELKVAPDLDV